MADTRLKDMDWALPVQASFDRAQLAVLMDLRDELKRLNNLLHCHNFIAIPNILRGIRKKLPAPKPRKAKR